VLRRQLSRTTPGPAYGASLSLAADTAGPAGTLALSSDGHGHN